MTPGNKCILEKDPTIQVNVTTHTEALDVFKCFDHLYTAMDDSHSTRETDETREVLFQYLGLIQYFACEPHQMARLLKIIKLFGRPLSGGFLHWLLGSPSVSAILSFK